MKLIYLPAGLMIFAAALVFILTALLAESLSAYIAGLVVMFGLLEFAAFLLDPTQDEEDLPLLHGEYIPRR